MRIKYITDKFASLENRSGAYMCSYWDRENQTQVLKWRTSGNPIAEIYDYKSPTNYRLRLHPKEKYCGRTEHINRLDAVLRSVQGNGSWDTIRYQAFIHYNLQISDRKLHNTYQIEIYPLEFQLTDGKLTLDYKALEQNVFPNETPTEVKLDTNSNLQTASNKLTAILAGV